MKEKLYSHDEIREHAYWLEIQEDFTGYYRTSVLNKYIDPLDEPNMIRIIEKISPTKKASDDLIARIVQPSID